MTWPGRLAAAWSTPRGLKQSRDVGLRPSARGLARRRRGVGFVWFAVISIPVIFLSGTFANDFSRIIVTHREVALAAQSAATGGSWQIHSGSPSRMCTTAAPCADRLPGDNTAQLVALNTWATEMAQNSAPGITVQSVTVPVPATIGNYQTLSVTVKYTINDMMFINWFSSSAAGQVYSYTATAFLCISSNNAGSNPTGGACSRPIN